MKTIDNKRDYKNILGMIMLSDNTFIADRFYEDFKSSAGYKTRDILVEKESMCLTVDDELVVIANAQFPIPIGDIEDTAQYAYNWTSALEDTKGHKSHLIVTIMRGGNDQVKRFKIFTKVICSLLRTTNSIGVYKGNQSLLIPKTGYLNEADLMDDKYLPLSLWIYFGLIENKNGNSGYTYGLKEFDKTELEIIDSSNSIEEILEFLFNMVHYILDCDVVFKDGETCGMSEGQRIGIRNSKGQFVEGDTLKLLY